MNQILEKEKIENLIYEIRGKQVMLDSDLAKLYKVETKRINEVVKRNKMRFPERYAFRITEEEYCSLKPQNATSKGGSRKGHTVFTEQGVAMLSTSLKSIIAINTSIAIMDAFVAMKKYISNNLIQQNYYNDMIIRHDSEIKLLQESFSKFEEKKNTNETYYNGQIYDAYSKIIEIFKTSKKELIIIDRYADITVLDMIKKLKVKVILVTKRNGNYTQYIKILKKH